MDTVPTTVSSEWAISSSALLHQGEDFLGALAENHALLGEGDFPGALGAPYQQLLAQLLLQGFQLGGEGGLGQVQGLGRGGDALFPGHRQKIM